MHSHVGHSSLTDCTYLAIPTCSSFFTCSTSTRHFANIGQNIMCTTLRRKKLNIVPMFINRFNSSSYGSNLHLERVSNKDHNVVFRKVL